MMSFLGPHVASFLFGSVNAGQEMDRTTSLQESIREYLPPEMKRNPSNWLLLASKSLWALRNVRLTSSRGGCMHTVRECKASEPRLGLVIPLSGRCEEMPMTAWYLVGYEGMLSQSKTSSW